MTSERRRQESRGLRQLFQEQWQQFLSLLERTGVEPSASQLDAKIDKGQIMASIETMIEGTDRRLRALGDYKKRLRTTVAWMLDYIDKSVSCLPEPILVDRQSFATNPAVNAFFVNYEDIRSIFGNSYVLRQFFSRHENASCSQVYAAMFINRYEKNILGKAMDNDVLLSDVKQTAVNFSAHDIVIPSRDEVSLRLALKEHMFNEIIQYVSIYMTELRHQQCDGKPSLTAEESINSVCNPQVYMDELISLLSIPNTMLTCEKKPLRLNKMGIMVDENSKEAINAFTSHEFKIGKQASRVVLLVRYDKNQML